MILPYLVVFAVGAAAGIYATSKTEDIAKLALLGGAIFVGGKYAKAW